MRVLLLDDSFTSWLGHNAAYNAAIVNELNQRGISSEVFANTKAADLQNDFAHGLHPVFRNYATMTLGSPAKFGPQRFIDKLVRLIKANWDHYKDLSQRVTSEVSDGDCIIVCMQSAGTSFAYSLWVRQMLAKGLNVSILLIIHNAPIKTFRLEVKSLRKLIRNNHLAFAAHTTAVVEFCRRNADITPTLLPLPHLPHLVPNEPIEFNSPKFATLFGYFGLASQGKGFDVLVDALPYMAGLLREGKIRFAIQATPYSNDVAAQSKCERLAQLAQELPGIEVIDQPLSDSEYMIRMQQADIVVIPNRAEAYKYALSGTFAEAVSLGKPVVVAKGTYMAETLALHNTNTEFISGDPASLAKALESTYQVAPQLSLDASRRAKQWAAYHNASSFVDRLLPLFKL